jgi:hippurate hydrolase
LTEDETDKNGLKMQLPESIEKLFSPSLQKKILALRRDLHQHPELSFQEERTAEKLTDALAVLEPVDLHRVADTGVIARIKGKRSGGKIVALRGDIDALPVQEATGLPFTSKHEGVMHACGHDVHASWTVGAAYLLSEHPAVGDVLIVLQPGEETGQGALRILKSGVLDGVAAIFGGHVDSHFEVGQVVAQPGPMGASTDSFEITLKGAATHGARPHEGIDPIVGSGALIMALQTIVSRKINPAAPAVLTVGRVHGGSAPNIIPESVVLEGTLRATDSSTRQLLKDELKKIARASAEAHRLKADVKIKNGTPPVVNHAQAAEWARSAAVSLLGKESVVPMLHRNMGGEDFAYYLEKIPGAFLRIGARELGGKPIAAHSPQFFVPDETMFVGAAVMAEVARVASEALNG